MVLEETKAQLVAALQQVTFRPPSAGMPATVASSAGALLSLGAAASLSQALPQRVAPMEQLRCRVGLANALHHRQQMKLQ